MKKIVLYLLGISIIIVVLLTSEINETLEAVGSVNTIALLVLCILQIITLLLITSQWKLISKKLIRDLTFLSVLDVNMKGTLVETLTPALKTGGEVTKYYLMKSKWNISSFDSVTIIYIQKLISIFTFTGITLLIFLWMIFGDLRYYELVSSSFELTMFVLLALLLIFSSILLYPKKTFEIVRKIPLEMRGKQKLNSTIKEFNASVKKINLNSSDYIKLFILATIIWTLFGIKGYLLAESMNMGLGFAIVFAITILSYLVGMLPITPGGLGTFEATMVLLLGTVGISVSTGIVFAIIFRFVTYWFVFIISLIYVSISKISSRLSMLLNH
ncbi:UPF0104 family protein [Methanosalsum natronophilum]|uniref:UPF0104 family protein n=1 Tax=Methanosalsum natronophilum TaxID=768733 RepID=A0A3R7WAR1_9EURY|nr:MAG: UPF0104 family protein [Methanosalsum natronophilum]